MVNFNELFSDLSVDEMKEALKEINASGKEFIKNLANEAKEKLVADIKANLKVGDIVNVKFKDEVISGEVVDIREKTFSILTSDILNVKGEPTKVSRNFNLIVQD